MEALLNAALPDSGDSIQTLVSFPAGKMTKEDRTVTADPRRGTFSLIVSAEDTLTHLLWRARGTSEPDIDLIIFPGDCSFHMVTSCPESARVYCLRWAGADGQRLFFWMQHVDSSEDEELLESVNKILTEGVQVS
jgi:hypothetical protein